MFLHFSILSWAPPPLFFHLEGGGVKEWHLSCNKSITYVVNRNNEILYYKIYFFDMVFIIKWLTVSPDIYLVWFLKKWSSLTFFLGGGHQNYTISPSLQSQLHILCFLYEYKNCKYIWCIFLDMLSKYVNIPNSGALAMNIHISRLQSRKICICFTIYAWKDYKYFITSFRIPWNYLNGWICYGDCF